MPKAKPNQVIVHRIELQETERDLLSGMTAAFQFNRIADPLVKLLNDVTGTVTVLTLLAASGLLAGVTFAFIYDPDAFTDPIEQYLQQYREAKELADEAGEVYGSAGGPLRGLIDLFEFLTGDNLPDFGAGYEPPRPPPTDYYSQLAVNPEWIAENETVTSDPSFTPPGPPNIDYGGGWTGGGGGIII